MPFFSTARPGLPALAAAALTTCILLLPAGSDAQELPSVFLEELTWTEVRDALEAGHTTAIVPTAGTEQNGPHMVLGKHRYIIEHASERIAEELGDALVAPAMVYVPEGEVDPPSGHMRYPGTITLPNEHFETVLEYTARSLAAHGFTDIVFIGDSGGNQRGMSNVAEMLNGEWSGQEARVHFVGDYYADNGFRDYVSAQGIPEDVQGGHAGVIDTSQLLYVNPRHIRIDELAPGGGFEGSGVSGDPTRASIQLGAVGMRMKVDTAVRQIRELRGR
jgi:creatinine amidohydrolase/Fe(II)-dependent formamide hydrolase-like protein